MAMALPPLGTKRKVGVVARLLPEDFADGKQMPLEPSKPRFSHIPYALSNPETLKSKLEAEAPPAVTPHRFWRAQRRRRFYKKPTPREAMTGSAVSGVCSFVALKGVMALYEHVSLHPLAHNLPFGLTKDVNEGVSTMVMGFGMLAVSLFAVSSIGLGLLTLELLYKKRYGGMFHFHHFEQYVCQHDSLGNFLSLLGFTVSEARATNGAPQVFERSCMGCHARGGNILQPGATLKLQDLERNRIFTAEDIAKITYNGKGRMPGFGEACTPRGQCTFGPRLSDQVIQELAEFVKAQAQANWPDIK